MEFGVFTKSNPDWIKDTVLLLGFFYHCIHTVLLVRGASVLGFSTSDLCELWETSAVLETKVSP